MNCQQFTSLIVELARGQVMDAAARDRLTRHADTCAACAARLAHEQSLTAALRTVAQSERERRAGARVEANLLAAFHANLGNRSGATAPDSNTRPASPAQREATLTPLASRRPRRTAYVATTAIAASLALVIFASLGRQFLRTEPTPSGTANVRQPVQSAPQVIGEQASASPTTTSATPVGLKGVRDENRTPSPRVAGAKPSPARAARAPRPRMILSEHVIDGGNAIIEASEGEVAGNNSDNNRAAKPNEAESVTEFIPLEAFATGAPPPESGQLVRVQLPRAALASLGLPLNAERENEPVKADVLLGNDGLARAIRFVR